MANFGFSIGDIILVSNYAYSVYKSSKHAGESFKAVTADVKSLQSYLHTLQDEFENPKSLIHRSSPAQRNEVRVLLRDCRSELHELKKLLSRYKSLKSDNPRARDKLTFTANKQADIKAKIAIHSDRLHRFLNGLHTGALARIEGTTEAHVVSFDEIKAKLDSLHQDVRAGKRDPSILTNMDGWLTLEQELLDDNITETDVETNREEIASWLERIRIEGDLKKAVQRIEEQEQSTEDVNTSIEVGALDPTKTGQNENSKPSTQAPDTLNLHSTSPASVSPVGKGDQVPHEKERVGSGNVSLSTISSHAVPETETHGLTLAEGPAVVGHPEDEIPQVGRAQESSGELPNQSIPRVSTAEISDPKNWMLLPRDSLPIVAYKGEVNAHDRAVIVTPKKKPSTRNKDNPVHFPNKVARLGHWPIRKTYAGKTRARMPPSEPPTVPVPSPPPTPNKLKIDAQDGLHDTQPPFIETMKITLCEAFCGWTREFELYDGSKYRASCPGPTLPFWTHLIPENDLPPPLQDGPSKTAGLLIQVAVQYPESLTLAQRHGVAEVLTQSGKPGRFNVERIQGPQEDSPKRDYIALPRYFPRKGQWVPYSCKA